MSLSSHLWKGIDYGGTCRGAFGVVAVHTRGASGAV